MHQPKLRCAVYTRKSTEEGLDQEFNSLDAQREACSAFIASQVGLGWKLVADHYDDGGISGGTMERPALQRLLQDIRDRKVDVVVVYKIDRLTRSLTDFSRIVEVFDASNASFVSVTQQFNTTTSMGRLTLNVLLSFAQFEREVTAERIRDKIVASKKKGMWMGGTVPLGYEVCDRKLIIKQPEADFVRRLFERYIDLRSVPAVVAEINRKAAIATAAADQDDGTGVATRSYTRRMHSGMVYKLLANPLYIGKLRHRDNVYDGEHDAAIDLALFDRVQSLLATKATLRRGPSIQADSHLLTGILYDDTGDRMSPTHARKQDMRYRYYISSRLCPAHRKLGEGWRLPAKEIEGVVLNFASQMLEDRSELAGWIEQHTSSDHIHPRLATAGILKATLADAASADRKRSLLRMVFQRITLGATTITFAVDVGRLVRMLAQGEVPLADAQPVEIAEKSEAATDQAAIVTITLPLQMKRRGNEARIIVESGTSLARSPDSSLVHLIARAHIYLAAITERPGTTLVDVAERYSVHQADVGRILPLAFLSPTITDAILSGRQPVALSARQLARLELPSMWSDQVAAIPA